MDVRHHEIIGSSAFTRRFGPSLGCGLVGTVNIHTCMPIGEVTYPKYGEVRLKRGYRGTKLVGSGKLRYKIGTLLCAILLIIDSLKTVCV